MPVKRRVPQNEEGVARKPLAMFALERGRREIGRKWVLRSRVCCVEGAGGGTVSVAWAGGRSGYGKGRTVG